jgi:chitosanase
MRTEEAHRDTTRVETAQRLFLRRNNPAVGRSADWQVYGDKYRIAAS